MEEALEEISAKLGVEPKRIMQHIWAIQGPGGGGSQDPDRRPLQGERRLEDTRG